MADSKSDQEKDHLISHLEAELIYVKMILRNKDIFVISRAEMERIQHK